MAALPEPNARDFGSEQLTRSEVRVPMEEAIFWQLVPLSEGAAKVVLRVIFGATDRSERRLSGTHVDVGLASGTELRFLEVRADRRD